MTIGDQLRGLREEKELSLGQIEDFSWKELSVKSGQSDQ